MHPRLPASCNKSSSSPGAGGPDRAAPHSRLHNFNLKGWGAQRHLRRCTNLRARRSDHEDQEKAATETAAEEKIVTRRIEEKKIVAERRVFCVTLLRDEIEEDIYALKGTRPSRRPRKRPRGIQRELDMLFPGCFLTEITLDSYKVVE